MKKCPFCAEEVQDAAIVCKHCRHELVAPAATVGTGLQAPVNWRVIVLAVLIAVLGWFVLGSGILSPTDSSGRLVMPQSPVGQPPVVTKAEFDQIQEGMSYSQVVLIIGASGEMTASSELAGFKTVAYSWVNSNGSNMNAMFQNDKLVTKAQFGLP